MNVIKRTPIAALVHKLEGYDRALEIIDKEIERLKLQYEKAEQDRAQIVKQLQTIYTRDGD